MNYNLFKYILAVGIVLLFSCEKKKQNDIKKIKAKDISVAFYDPNNIKSIEVNTGNEQNEFIDWNFYNGNILKSKIFYRNGRRYKGIVFDSTNSKISEIHTHIVQGGRLMSNEVITYFRNSNVVDKESSKFLSVSVSKDTIEMNESIELKVELKASAFPRASNVYRKLVIGDLDNSYLILNPKTLKVFDLDVDNVGKIEMKFNRFGENMIRGFIVEKAILSDSSDSINMICFSREIYVKSPNVVQHVNLIKNYKFYDSLVSK